MHDAELDPSARSDERPADGARALATGAEALAHVLREQGLSTAFAYPGTSELHLCNALIVEGMRVLNSRGDREAVFMAAGANRAKSGSSVAVIHGARGLTNALGAIADARRSEAPVLCVVGMATSTSAAFLPPHAEPNLITSAGAFARHAFECGAEHLTDPPLFVEQVRRAVRSLDEVPSGPVLLGVPQDLLRTPFVPRDLLEHPERRVPAASSPSGLEEADDRISAARRPVILMDDYALSGDDDAEQMIGQFAARIGAPILQVRYRRGPMLFPTLSRDVAATSWGFYRPEEPEQRRLVAECDLLITIEDRNMYPRVVGDLGTGSKLAITSNALMTTKNGYIRDDDLVVTGTLRQILPLLATSASRSERLGAWRTSPDDPSLSPTSSAPSVTPAAAQARELVAALGEGLKDHGVRLLVDDSQVFGGLVSRHAELLPSDARILGSHGGFVGSGLPTAVGAAAALDVRTVCLLGDQGLTNAVQALSVAAQESCPLLVVVCNNGSSVSLRTQAEADGDRAVETLLSNVPMTSYTAVARGFGLRATQVNWPGDGDPSGRDEARTAVLAAIEECFTTDGPFLLEIVTPDDHRFWDGVWSVHGLDEAHLPTGQRSETSVGSY